MSIQFTPDQLAAITAPPGDVIIQALAGTAKTSVLAWRIAYLIKRHGYQPRNIAAITYSTRAADSLLNKITWEVGQKCGRVLGMTDLKVATIHSYAMGLLKSIPRFRKYEVIDEGTRRLLVRRHFKRLGVAGIPRIVCRVSSAKYSASLTQDPHDVGQRFLATLDRVREELLPDSALPPHLRAAYHAYLDLLDSECVWDYAQVIAALDSALRDVTTPDNLALQQAIASNLKVIAVDEAQDCDPAMWAVLTRFRELGAHLLCVGDENQTIFRFRSADPAQLQRFGEETDRVRSLSLTTNFRASDGLVSVANSILDRFLRNRADSLLTMKHGSIHRHDRGDIAALRFVSPTEQYKWGAKRLKSLLGTAYPERTESEPRGLIAQDMAVLVRCRRQMSAVVAALREEGLEAIVRGADSLLVAREAEMLATALDFLADGRNTWDRKTGKVVVTPVTEEDVDSAIRATGFIVKESAIEEGIRFLTCLRDSEDWSRPLCLIEVLEEFLQSMGITYVGDSSAGEQVRWESMKRVLLAAVQFQRGWGFATPLKKKLPAFARWLRIEAPFVVQGDEEYGSSTLRDRVDAVSVMTVHAAKGLEFPVVWMPDLAQNILPLRYRPPDIWEVLPQKRLTDSQVRRLQGTATDHMTDEARLWYVGMTRATKWFLATYAPPDGEKRPKPSPFFLHLEQRPGVARRADDLPPLVPSGYGPLPPVVVREYQPIRITATELAVYWACPRQFYLRFIVRLPPPIQEAIGYGQSLHNAAWEVHRCSEPDYLTSARLEEIALRHFHLPFAGKETKEALRSAATRAIPAYVESRRDRTNRETIVATEQEVSLEIGGLRIDGRVDLLTAADDGSTLVELKTARNDERDPEQMVPRTYALGLQVSTGQLPERVETRIISGAVSAGKTTQMTQKVLDDTVWRIREAGTSISRGKFPALPVVAAATCRMCDVRMVCAHSKATTS
jgi:DNA helicase II / ATP-dependent DNA helicase PcrA